MVPAEDPELLGTAFGLLTNEFLGEAFRVGASFEKRTTRPLGRARKTREQSEIPCSWPACESQLVPGRSWMLTHVFFLFFS